MPPPDAASALLSAVRDDDPDALSGDGAGVVVTRDAASRDDGGASSDGACDPMKGFGKASLLAGVNSLAGEFGVAISRDELELFLTKRDSQNRQILHRATRPTLDASFSLPEPIVELSTPALGVTISADGLELFFSALPPPRRIFRTTRATRTSPFRDPTIVVFPAWTSIADDQPSLGPESQLLFSSSSSAGGQKDIYGAQRDDAGAFRTPTPLASLNTLADDETWPVAVASNRSLFYASGNASASVIRESRRASSLEPYTPGTVVTFVNANAISYPVAASADGCRLYFVMENAQGGIGGADVWVASRLQ